MGVRPGQLGFGLRELVVRQRELGFGLRELGFGLRELGVWPGELESWAKEISRQDLGFRIWGLGN